MSETAAPVTTTATNNEGKTPGKIVSVGNVEPFKPSVPRDTLPSENSENSNSGGNNNGGSTPAANTGSGTQPAATNTPAANQTPANNSPAELTDDQLKAFFEKQGIAFEGIDKLKEKLASPAAPPVLTDEQKAKLEKEKEDRIVNAHLARNGTVQQLAIYKEVLTTDKKVLGLQKEIEDLVAEGFTKERAEELAKERYFQLTDEEIEKIEDADLKKEAIKQRNLGVKKLENKGGYLQQRAQGYFKILEQELAASDAEKTKMEQHSSKVEDAIKAYERKTILNLGKLDDGVEIPSLEFEYSDTALASAKEFLKDSAKLDENLFTKEGDWNIPALLPHLVRSFSMDEAVKKSYLTGQNRAVEFFEAKFGSTPPPLGGNGKNNNGTPGKIVGVGERQVFKPAYKK